MEAGDPAVFSVRRLQQEAQNRWLKPSEVLFLLENVKEEQLSQKPPTMPFSGSIFFYSRRVNRYFRQDGYLWKKKKDGKTVGEAHEKLKVGSLDTLNCYYARGEFNPNFQRRSYWMLNPNYDDIVLVHYLEVTEGVHSFGSLMADSGSNNNEVYLISGFEGGENWRHYDNSCSPGSVSDINSGTSFGTNHSDRLDTRSPKTSTTPSNAALRKLAAQLSLEDCDDYNESQPERQVNPLTHFSCEETECGLNRLENSSQVLGCSHNSEEDARPQFNSCSIFSTYAADGSKDAGSSSVHVKENDAISRDMIERAVIGGNLPPLQYEGDSYWTLQDKNNFGGILNEDITPNENVIFPSINEQSWVYSESPTYNSTEVDFKFVIREISPNWAYSTESTKVIIVGDFHCTPEGSWTVMFGETVVPAETIQQGVLRCWAPQHLPGCINVCVTSGYMEARSEFAEFTYIMKPDYTRFPVNCHQFHQTKSTDELLLLVNFVQILLRQGGSVEAKVEGCNSSNNQSGEQEKVNHRLDQLIQAVLSGSGSSTWIVDQLLEELLRDKLQKWLEQKNQSETSGLSSKKDYRIIHILSGLGYEWALKPVLDSGVGVNFRDVRGWTSLHWAARFGREKMVATLLAAGALAEAVTDSTKEDLLGKTPSSIAAEYGHKGLAGYLAEVALSSHLSSLTVGETEISRASAANRAAQDISEKIRSINFTETDDQLSLNDSLDAVVNATQAAARIQSAFRAHSFRKKQQKNASYTDGYDITPGQIHDIMSRHYKLHRGVREQKYQVASAAALCIQKKFRGWKGRKNFLKLHQNAVRIQAHVRGYQVRKRFRFSMTVSILEKAILRWRRKGSGLRGTRIASEFESMDDAVKEEEEILNIFRREKVDGALKVALSRVLSMANSLEARQQYRRVLESFHQAKAELCDSGTSASEVFTPMDDIVENILTAEDYLDFPGDAYLS